MNNLTMRVMMAAMSEEQKAQYIEGLQAARVMVAAMSEGQKREYTANLIKGNQRLLDNTKRVRELMANARR